jgi:hypothetical protein
MTDDLRQKFEKYTALNYPITRNLIHDVMQCSAYWELKKIQTDIKRGVYGEFTSVTE